MATIKCISISSSNVSKICRICLLEETNMQSLFDPVEKEIRLDEDVTTLWDVLCQVTNVQPEENEIIPNLICQNCIELLKYAYKFKIQFEWSYKCIEEFFLTRNSTFKDESLDIDEEEAEEEGPLIIFNNIQKFDNNGDEYEEKIVEDQPIILDVYESNDNDLDDEQPEENLYDASQEQIIVIHNDVSPPTSKRRFRKIRPKGSSDYETDDETNYHEANESKTPILHPCPICTKEFPALELREHAHTHKALKRYLSIPPDYKVSANARFYYKHDPDKERITLQDVEIKMHKCVMCNEQFTANELRLHLETHRNQKEFKCDQCDRVFRKLNHLNTHKVKHLKEFPYKCEHCNKGFVIKKNYDCHILTHNTNQELPHECTHCLKRFSNPEHLNRHKIIHTENVSYSVKYRVCKCSHCLKTFRDKSELKSHECVPVGKTSVKKYPCKTCEKVFKSSSGLHNHNRKTHKLNTKTLCSVCGKYVSNIYNHMMRHTGEKPYQCNQCGKRFVGKPQLNQHLLVHSGLKPFVCSVCAKAFNNLYNLQVHERIHKGDKCHICPICRKGFLEKSYLKKHIMVHTKTRV